jgi:hypothetical protein
MARLGYCSACDRNVPVVLRKPLENDTMPSPSDARALVCLDYGVRCTGSLCPLFTVPGQDGRRDRSDSDRPEVRPV